MSDSSLLVDGTFSNSGVINRSNTVLTLKGWYDNTGNTVVLDAAQGAFILSGGGTIHGGTISSTDGAPLQVAPHPWRFDGLCVGRSALNANVVGDTTAGLEVRNGLQLDNTSIKVNDLIFEHSFADWHRNTVEQRSE